MGKYEDLTGQRFGKLTVLCRAKEDKIKPSGERRIKWHCKCDCGNECDVRAEFLKNHHTRSCGCQRGKRQKRLPNEYIDKGDFYILVIDGGLNVLIDSDDYEKCKQYQWRLARDGRYFICGKLYLHRFVYGEVPEGYVVDHINGDLLDNRKSNLRLCTHEENMRNSSPRNGKYPGVNKTKSGTWSARLKVKQKVVFEKRFKTEEEAIQARIEAEEKYYGEYGYYNSRIKNKEENNLWEESMDIATQYQRTSPTT